MGVVNDTFWVGTHENSLWKDEGFQTGSALQRDGRELKKQWTKEQLKQMIHRGCFVNDG